MKQLFQFEIFSGYQYALFACDKYFGDRISTHICDSLLSFWDIGTEKANSPIELFVQNLPLARCKAVKGRGKHRRAPQLDSLGYVFYLLVFSIF
jgi:hypothetical protein